MPKGTYSRDFFSVFGTADRIHFFLRFYLTSTHVDWWFEKFRIFGPCCLFSNFLKCYILISNSSLPRYPGLTWGRQQGRIRIRTPRGCRTTAHESHYAASCYAAHKIQKTSNNTIFHIYTESVVLGDLMKMTDSLPCLEIIMFLMYVHYLQLLLLQPSRFHCVGGCWIERRMVATLALAARRSNPQSTYRVEIQGVYLPGQIFPSWDVRQKSAIATLCVYSEL